MKHVMPISARISPPMPTRPCRFSLGLQNDSVFADFEVDDDGRVFLCRISFDGFGCCDAPTSIKRMTPEDSHMLLKLIDHGAANEPMLEVILQAYFHENAKMLWRDALHDHGLI